MRSEVLLLLAGCGRLGFDAVPAVGPDDSGIDACVRPAIDATSSLPSALGVFGAGVGNEWARAVTGTHRGGYVIAGQYSSPISIAGTPLTNSGSIDVFVISVDAAGGLEWAREVTSSGSDETALGVTVDEVDNVYVVGNGNAGVDCGGGSMGWCSSRAVEGQSLSVVFRRASTSVARRSAPRAATMG